MNALCPHCKDGEGEIVERALVELVLSFNSVQYAITESVEDLEFLHV